MSDEAKTTEEAAKTVREEIEAGDRVGRYLDKIVGGALAEVGGIFTDWAAYYRYHSLLVILEKVEALHKQKGIDARMVPGRVEDWRGNPLGEPLSVSGVSSCVPV